MILSGAIVYSAYTAWQIRALRDMQHTLVDRNRMDSLLLLRIQNDLNSLGLALRDMQDATESYPLSAWESQLRRIRLDLEDAMAREAKLAAAERSAGQSSYLANSLTQFWDALDRNFALSRTDEKEARQQVRLSLQARLEALSTAVSRLLIENNESQEQAAAEVERIYARVERNLYLFFALLLVVVGLTGAYLLRYNRRLFDQVNDLSARRSELARQLITTQENTYRSISRELHDDFGQILTAVGLMLQRAPQLDGVRLSADLQEVREMAQLALDKVRTLSQALHPVMLEEVGLEGAIANYVPVFSKRTGIPIEFKRNGDSRRIDGEVAIHTYRILQEALNNVARHANAQAAWVRYTLEAGRLVLEVEDDGGGYGSRNNEGMGLVSMRERAEIMKGAIHFGAASNNGSGARVLLTVPLD